jgi:LysR family transcriptional regulator, positive regulator for ilvC
MDHYAIKLFLHLAESLHFGQTSRACNISPSALSRQIQRMEDLVGKRLFERDNRKVTLTPAGLLVKDYARGVIEKWDELKDALSVDEEELKGEISIYCSVTASLSILPDMLSRFKTTYPKVHIRLQTGDAGVAVRQVVQGDVDFAVAALPDQLPPNLAFKVITMVDLEFIAPDIPWDFDTENVKKISWSEIPMILSQRGIARQRVDAWLKQRKITPNIYAIVSGNEAILSMVALGCGIGVVPGLAIDNSPVKNRVRRLPVASGPAPYPVGICTKKRGLSSRLIQAFWETATSVKEK